MQERAEHRASEHRESWLTEQNPASRNCWRLSGDNSVKHSRGGPITGEAPQFYEIYPRSSTRFSQKILQKNPLMLQAEEEKEPF